MIKGCSTCKWDHCAALDTPCKMCTRGAILGTPLSQREDMWQAKKKTNYDYLRVNPVATVAPRDGSGIVSVVSRLKTACENIRAQTYRMQAMGINLSPDEKARLREVTVAAIDILYNVKDYSERGEVNAKEPSKTT